jgi:hypothetical protein
MRYCPIIVGIVIVTYFITCSTTEHNHSAQKSDAEEKLTVLRPVEAGLTEKVDAPVEVLEIKIKQKKGEPFEFKRAQFVNDKTGWAMTNKSVYKTSDGGNKWDRLGVIPQEDASFTSFHFIDDYRGWLTELKQIYVERYGLGNSSRILATDDGGTSWRVQVTFPNEVKFRDIKFLNAKEGLAIGAKVVDGPKAVEHSTLYDEIFVLKAENGGQDWIDISEGVKTAIKNQYGIANDFAHYIHWITSSSILLLTKYGKVISTSDSCFSWKTIASFQVEPPDNFLKPTGYFKLLLDPRKSLE